MNGVPQLSFAPIGDTLVSRYSPVYRLPAANIPTLRLWSFAATALSGPEVARNEYSGCVGLVPPRNPVPPLAVSHIFTDELELGYHEPLLSGLEFHHCSNPMFSIWSGVPVVKAIAALWAVSVHTLTSYAVPGESLCAPSAEVSSEGIFALIFKPSTTAPSNRVHSCSP